MLDNLILFLFICISVYGAPVTTEVITAAAPGELTAYATFIGILAIVAGLFLAFSGYRLFRTALFVAGFLVFSNISSIVVQRLDTAQTVTGTTLLLICFGAGVIGGFVAQGLWRFGLSLIGAVGGGAIAASLLTLKSGFLIEADGNRLLFILACAIIGAVMIHFFEKPMLIGSTAVAGSTVAIFGLDVFVKTGYADAVIFFLQNTRAGINNGIFPHAPLDYSYLFTGSVGGMVFGVIALTIAGSISQFKSAEGVKHR
jgi:hypothetical protein